MELLIRNVNENLNICIHKWLHQSIKKRVKDFKQWLIPRRAVSPAISRSQIYYHGKA